MIYYIVNIKYNGLLAILLYYVPLLFCVYGYTLRTYVNYREDVANRNNASHYSYFPTDTLGSLIGRAIVTILPFSNLCACIFDLAPEVFGRFFKVLTKVFNQPLVPDSEAAKAKRKQ